MNRLSRLKKFLRSAVWYLLPCLSGPVGGTISYLHFRGRDKDEAEFVFWVGVDVSPILLVIIVNVWPLI